MWSGSTPTVLRAMAMNVGMLTTFDEVKQKLNKMKGTKDEVSTRIIASCVSGFVCSFMSLPFDNNKTKLQKMKANEKGEYPYAGVFDCFKKSVAREGVAGLWVGFPTYYIRVAPHAIITLLIQDYLHQNFMGSSSK